MSENIPIDDESMDWAEEEFINVNIGDKRLNKRLISIMKRLVKKPKVQIPQAMDNFAQAKAAYRFFDNKKVTAEKIFNASRQALLKRLEGENTILVIQDTTVLDYSKHPSVANLGLAGNDKSKGFMLHLALAVSAESIPLGLVDFNIWTRDENENTGDNRAIREKESSKWIRSYRETEGLRKEMNNVHFVNICDREGDIYDFFNEARGKNKSDLLVRASRNRRIEQDQKYLWEYMNRLKKRAEVKIKVPRKKGQSSRIADVSIRWAKVGIKAPEYRKDEGLPESINLWAVYAKEEAAPAGFEPISWMLLTTIPVKNLKQALEKISWYMRRWMIELFFKVLKSGCNTETRQLKDVRRLKNSIILDAIVAWRLMFLTYIGRALPDLPASVVFEEYEWQALYSFEAKKVVHLEKEPLLGEVMIKVALLGGFLGRKSDGHPGMTTIRRGLAALHYISIAWKIFHSQK